MKKANFCYAVLTASAVLTLGTVFSASAAQWQALGDEWLNIPCCKDVYYNLYRRFFWLLNKARD